MVYSPCISSSITPITAIKGYVEGLMDGVADTPEKMKKYISSDKNSKKSNLPNIISDDNSNEKQSNAADDSFNIGEIAEYNDVQVTVLSYEESIGNEWVQPESGIIFVFPEIEITNNSDDEISVSSMISFDCYIGDYKADFSSNAFMALSTESGKQQLDGSIAPGKKIKGVLGIEAPSDWSTIEIYYKDNVWLSSNFSFLISK